MIKINNLKDRFILIQQYTGFGNKIYDCIIGIYLKYNFSYEILGVHQRTLYLWDKKKIIETIRTPGGKRLYNVKKYLEEIDRNKSNVTKINVPEINEKLQSFKVNYIYTRVSSLEQKEDLERQKALLQKEYPNHTLITDIGSGMNLNRVGLRKIIDKSIEGKVNEVVIVQFKKISDFFE